MNEPAGAPRIIRCRWGRLEVEGSAAPYKDAKLFPGGSRAWDWNETGTRHSPGVQPADVDELLAHGARTVVLSRGMLGRLEVSPETLVYLAERDVTVHVHSTGKAVRLYNELREAGPVGCLIHSTC